MELNKKSYKADAIANLYRAALYFARGTTELGLDFLKKTEGEIGKAPIKELEPLFFNPSGNLKTRKKQLFWAEKVLDRYKTLKSLTSL